MLADQVGVDFFGVGEHHRQDFAVSSPETVLAVIAGRTERIGLGSAVTVLSSDDPVRVFERFATLDAASSGRAEVILGRGLNIWVRRYVSGGMAALVDQSTKPLSCPHQMAPATEVRVLQCTPLPARSSIYRTLVRHHRIDPTQRERSKSGYKRWERSRSMELWQMDIVGRFHLADRSELLVRSGFDDHSRFRVCARSLLRATAKPVVAALEHALKVHGVPDQILTDTARSSPPALVQAQVRCSSTGSHVQWDRSRPDRALFADDGQGRALPQGAPQRVLHPQRLCLCHHRRGPSRTRHLGERVQHRATAPVLG